MYGRKGRIEDVNWKEWSQAIGINLFGSILMARAFLPHFRKNKYGKIIQLSGGGATAPLPLISAYAASKAAIVRFAETLAEEVKEDGIDVNSIAPGALNTRLLDEVLEAGPEKVGKAFSDIIAKSHQEPIKTPFFSLQEICILAKIVLDTINIGFIINIYDSRR